MNVIPVGAKQLGADLRILAGFDPAQLGLRIVKHNRVDTQPGKERRGLLARFSDQIAGEKPTVADNDAQGEVLRNSGHCSLSSNLS